MTADRSSQPQDRHSGRPWVAEVGRRLAPSTATTQSPEMDGLVELAAEAGDAARRSAELASTAAEIARQAAASEGRIDEKHVAEIRETTDELVKSAEQAADSALSARDKAALTLHAVQSDLDLETSVSDPASPSNPRRRT